jgi:membrane protein DedA with SNARE-associated domain
MNDILLTQVINYGAPLVGLILLLGALGFPVGASVVVIAAGAFAQQGFLDWVQASLIGLAGAALGDMVSFGMGHFAKDWIHRRFGTSAAWLSARASFDRQGGIAVFFTRWLVTAFAIPTNLIAGGSGYKFSRFMFYDIAGETVWILLYGGLGYAFGSQWELVSEFLGNFGGLILGLVVLGFGVRQLVIWQRQSRNRITAADA